MFAKVFRTSFSWSSRFIIRSVSPTRYCFSSNRSFFVLMGSAMSNTTGASTIPPSSAEIKFSEEELRKRLTPMQYHVTQEKGTERSHHKFDSGSGWPSFYEVMNSEAVQKHTDTTHGMKRVEVTCKKCGSHLGHVFDDGPNPTGQRYCINSASLKFNEKKNSEL